MSIMSALFNNKTYSFEQAFNAKDITSSEMREAIQNWFALYFDSDSEDEDNCQRLPFAIVNKLSKTVFSEYSVTFKKDSEFMQNTLDSIDKTKKYALQQALIGGECFIKPVIKNGGFEFIVIRRDCFIPLARNAQGEVTSVGTAEFTALNGKYYTLLERRSVMQDGRLMIENRLYMSDTKNIIGVNVPLDTLDKYSQIQPQIILPTPLNGLGMVQLKTPMANCVDGSMDGVSVYAPAVNLIKNINRNEKQLCEEFENGASRIIASEDMLAKDANGKKKFSDKLFVAVDDNPSDVGVTIFSPTLRENSYLQRKAEYLRNIESLIGFKRGILSEVEAMARTATEVTSSEGEYNLTIIDFQQMWELSLRELVSICLKLSQMYQIGAKEKLDPQADIVVDWGDGVLYNRDRTWNEYLQMVQAGLLKPELAIAWYFKLPCKTQADVDFIRKNYLPQMEELLGDE